MTYPSASAATDRLPANSQPATTLKRVPAEVQTPPPLVWQDPLCPLCTSPVHQFGPLLWHPRSAWACRSCGATWDAAGEAGRFNS